MDITYDTLYAYVKGRIATLESDLEKCTKINEFNLIYGRLKELSLVIDFMNSK